MKKRIMSMLLVLLMAISLLPAAAMASDAEPTPNDTPSLYLGKSYDPADGMLTLETYAKGETIITEKVMPCDIVLVLDVSGSMGDDESWITVGNVSSSDLSQLDPVRGSQTGIYQVYQSNVPWPLSNWRDMRYYNGHWQYDRVGIGTNWTNIEDNWSWFPLNQVQIKKINALKIATDRFIDTVQKNAADNQVDHKISIVKFAGNSTNTVGNNMYNSNTYNYSQIVTNLTPVETVQQASNLKRLITPIVAGGATHADYGMTHAKNILTAANDPERGKVVILFTDGEPGETGFDGTVANNTVRTSKDLKDIGTMVYSIGVFGNDVDTRTHRYMNAVSSNHPDATVYTVGGTTVHDYYMSASNANALEEIFKKIAEEIGGSFIDLDEQSTVVDEMSPYFKLDGVTAADTSKVKVYTADCIGEDADGKFVFSTSLVPYTGASITVTDGDTVNVSGFDFSKNWVGKDGNNNYHGEKLVIKFPVQPKADAEGKVPTNSDNSGIYDKDGKLVAKYPVPQYTPATVSYVIDFNAKVNLATSVGQLGEQTRKNGEFDLADGTLSYQFFEKNLASGNASIVMNGVDSAMTFTSNVWTKYNAIPANNIYFDDALVNHAALTYHDGSGYNAGVGTDVSSGAGVINADGAKQLFFTFTGTGIDVYCTTDTNGGYVQAALLRGAEHDAANLIDGTRFAVRNYAETTRYNVPTVSYTGLDYGTYTVYIWAMAGSEYKLDGVRIYNPMQDQSVYDGTDEANARFFNLRENLLNDGKSVVFTDDPDKDYLTDNEVTILGENPGVLFIDDVDSVELKIEETGEAVYSNAYEAYVANGPKNEIYLSANQGVAFKLADGLTADHYWLGLSTPDTGSASATVLVNGKAVEPVITSAVDMYYPITPDKDGNVVVVNQGGGMVALTNLKVTSDNAVEEDGAQPFGLLSVKSLKIAANGTEASQEEVGNPGLQELIRQLISNFVKTLYDSISRLFGK